MDNRTMQTMTGNEDEAEIDLIDLLSYYISRMPLLIAAVVAGAVIAGAFTKFMLPDKFTAVSRMYMVSASSDSVVNLADLNIGTSLSNDYVELMKSRPVLEDVIEKLELDYTCEELARMIELSVVTNTRIILISVTSTDPQEATDIANQVARTAKIQLPKVMESPSPSIVEEAVVPLEKSSPSLKKNVLIGAALMLFTVLGVLTVLYLLDDTVKSSEDVEKTFGVMPLTVIPDVYIGGLKDEDDERSAGGSRKKRRGRRYLHYRANRSGKGEKG